MEIVFLGYGNYFLGHIVSIFHAVRFLGRVLRLGHDVSLLGHEDGFLGYIVSGFSHAHGFGHVLSV